MKKFGSAVILAGGKSTRMGFDKQRILIGGVLMVNYIARQLEPLFEDITIVSSTPELYGSTNYKVISDIYKNKGPLGGIHVGLNNASSHYVYFIAGDMPLVNVDYIQHMMEELEEGSPFACVTEVHGYIEPFNAFYSKGGQGLIADSILKEHLKVSRLVKEQTHLCMTEETARVYDLKLRMFMNLNTLQRTDNITLLEGPISVMVY